MNTAVIMNQEGLQIPQGTTQEQWTEIHRNIIVCKRAAGKWLSESRKWASSQWGVDFVADTEVQLELSLGLPQPAEKQDINPKDKSKVFVTIEGISQEFTLWQRKMKSDIPYWQKPQLERALELLEPLEIQAKEIRELLRLKH